MNNIDRELTSVRNGHVTFITTSGLAMRVRKNHYSHFL